MKTAIIIHGMPTKEEFDTAPCQSCQHWLPWLKEKLDEQKIATIIPEMPTPYAPVYTQWRDTFEQILSTEEIVLVGHSGGGGFLVRWISEQNEKVGKVVLVAPWIDPDHSDREHVTDFFDFEIDPHLVAKTNGITVFISDDDDIPMLRTVEKLEKCITGLRIIRKTDMGHFTKTDGISEFPELLKEIVS